MSKDIQDVIDKLGQEWTSFETEMKSWQKELEKKGYAAADTVEKIDKMAKAVEAIDSVKSKLDEQAKTLVEVKARADEMEERLNTPVITKNGDKLLPLKMKEAKDRYFRTCSPESLAEFQDYIQKSLNLTTAEQGGIFYTITHDSGIDPLIREICPLRQVCDVRQIGTGSYTFKKKTAAGTAGWVGEMEDRPETTAPTYAMQEIVTHECYAQPYVTQTMLEDAEFNVEQELNEDMAESFGELENVAFTSGNGVKRPRGLLARTFSATPTGEEVLFVKTGASGDWAASDPHLMLLGVGELLKAQYSANAMFMMSRARVAEVMKFVDGEKRPLWQPSYQAGTPSLLAGYPLLRNEHLPAKAANSFSVVFGDFKSAYRIIDRRGTSVLRDPYTGKPFVKFYTTRRVGGDVVRPEAFLAFKFIN